MRRLLAALALLACAAAAQTVTAGPGGADIQYSGSSTVAVTVNSVTAGALVVAMVNWGNGTTNTDTTTLSGISDGTSSFTCLATRGNGNYQRNATCYLLSANGGNKTYTATFSANLVYPAELWIFTATTSSGTWSYDASSVNYGNSTTANTTGNITLTGAAEFSVYTSKLYDAAASTSSPTMYGATPTEPTWSPVNTNDHGYDSTAVSTTGQGALTYSAATYWVAAIAAFKVGSAAAAATPTSVACCGVRR